MSQHGEEGKELTGNRIVPLSSHGEVPEARPEQLLHESGGFAEMNELAHALRGSDHEAVDTVLERGRRRLQTLAVDEMHRLTGRMLAEVAAASTLRDKTARAITVGSLILERRPSDWMIQQCADPPGFVAACDAACQAIRLFLTAELARALHEDISDDDARQRIDDAIDELSSAISNTEEDRLDRRAEVVAWLLRSFSAEARRRDRERETSA